jgi:hypothetical protein
VQVEDLAVSRPSFVAGRRAILHVAALAEDAELFDSEEAYRETGTMMATESLIPVGTFALPGSEEGFTVTPRIAMSGTVLGAEIRTNELYGRPFAYLRVRSLCHSFDVLAPAALLASAPGTPHVMRGTFWVAARLADAGQSSTPNA